MALVKCKECSEHVSSKAKRCAKCGAPVPRKWWWLLIFPGIFLFGLLAWGTTPQYEKEAYMFKKTCYEMAGKLQPMRDGCDTKYEELMVKKGTE